VSLSADKGAENSERRVGSDSWELLIRIDEQVKALRIGFDTERIAVSARAGKHEIDLDKIRTDVEGLRTSRAQFYAIAATLSTVIGILIRVFWK
jgi:hypothetical protein